jgi:hypothetical protein
MTPATVRDRGDAAPAPEARYEADAELNPRTLARAWGPTPDADRRACLDLLAAERFAASQRE